mmetsp:Transcript_62188/g.116362  ORF Transcript_62188/g.116362 Transcript_62188/m.116362 type:complete len:223 (-) Transcript_62188:108-776(-)
MDGNRRNHPDPRHLGFRGSEAPSASYPLIPRMQTNGLTDPITAYRLKLCCQLGMNSAIATHACCSARDAAAIVGTAAHIVTCHMQTSRRRRTGPESRHETSTSRPSSSCCRRMRTMLTEPRTSYRNCREEVRTCGTYFREFSTLQQALQLKISPPCPLSTPQAPSCASRVHSLHPCQVPRSQLVQLRRKAKMTIKPRSRTADGHPCQCQNHVQVVPVCLSAE